MTPSGTPRPWWRRLPRHHASAAAHLRQQLTEVLRSLCLGHRQHGPAVPVVALVLALAPMTTLTKTWATALTTVTLVKVAS